MTADYTRLRAVKAQLITDLQNLPFPVPTNVIEVMQADPETQRGYIRTNKQVTRLIFYPSTKMYRALFLKPMVEHYLTSDMATYWFRV